MPGPTTNVAEYLLGGKEPNRVALRLLNRDYSYGDLQAAVRTVSTYLLRCRLDQGERAVLAGENSLFWVAAYLGTMQAGMVSVPVPAGIAPEELDSILRTTEAKVAFVQARLLRAHGTQFAGMHVITDHEAPAVPGALSQLSLAELPAFTQASDGRAADVRPDDLAALMFTSGSTGASRGVMISHRNIIANTESIIEYLGLTERDRIMDVLPFHYCFGTSLLHTHLRVGGTVVVDPRFLYPEVLLQRMRETECTGFAGVPSHFQILLRKSSLASTPLPHLRYVQQAGGSLAPAFIRELRRALPQARIFIMYGQTEATARLSYLPPEFLDSKIGSIGKGIPGVRLNVLDDAGEPVRPGQSGEIVAQGENVAGGYWRAPQESAMSFRNRRLYTGDLATIDKDGFIYILGRAKDMIKCGGQRVSCRWLEEQIAEFDGIQEVAVTGMPDDVLGEAAQAFIVAPESPAASNGYPGSADALTERIRVFCKERLPPRLVPRRIAIVSHLPKNSSGKVLKSRLSALPTGQNGKA